jgi:signal transduction histidine kinase
MTTSIPDSAVLAVGGLLTSDDEVPPHMKVNRVADRFFRSTDLEAVAVVDRGEPVGLITRTKLMFALFRRFGFELYGREPIMAVADARPLIVDEGEQLDAVIDKALERPPQDLYDEIIVTDCNGCYRGLLSVRQLVIQQGNALAGTILQKELASEQARELEKINQAKSKFFAHIVHELRSPVNIIIGLAELMRLSAEKGNVGQVKDRLALLLTSAANLRTLVTNILDLSRIEARKMEVLTERFSLTELVRETAEAARVMLGRKTVAVEIDVPAEEFFMVSDPVKVRQILTNLVSNAAKFTEKGGIEISLKPDGETNVLIMVSDTGIGIREEDQDRLFHAFSRLEDTKTGRHEGTGLGLAITRSLVAMLGGLITFTSIFGQGTTFAVALPVSIKSKQEESHAA